MIYERTKGRKRNRDMMERHRAHAREKKRIMKGVLFTRWEKKRKRVEVGGQCYILYEKLSMPSRE